jgi:hypothetical protein
MSIAGIASSILFQLSSPHNSQAQQLKTEFQQLAQDLQAGNLTRAQTDFAALQQSTPAGFSSSANPLSQELTTLGSDLQSGKLSAAQQDFLNIQQTVEQHSQSSQIHHHHYHGGGAPIPASSPGQQDNPVTQLLNTLAKDLQTGNLTQAQQAYTQLAQSLQLFGVGSLSASGTGVPSSGLSLSA